MSKWVDVDRLLLELSDLIDEFSELDERGLHSERWCGIMDAKGVIANAPLVAERPQDEPQKWETPPKFEHKGIISTCVGVPMALIEDEPQTEREGE